MKKQIFETAAKKTYDVEFDRFSANEMVRCPVCADSRTKSKLKTLSYDHDKQVGKCHHCDAAFVSKDKLNQMKNNDKQYVRPKIINNTALSDRLITWFATRGISQRTLVDMRVGEGIEYMPQTQSEQNTIQFNYFREDELINVKYRDGAKNFKLHKDSELILYNLNGLKGYDWMIICEGEIDALSWYEAGFPNVVSVPNGASKTNRLDYIDNCFDYLKDMKKIYLSTDDDEPGRALRDELARRFGYDSCYLIEHPGYKDINEFLLLNTKDAMEDLIRNARQYPIDGVYSISDIWTSLEDIYNNGLPVGAKTGDARLDNHIGFMPGELTVITGIPGHGKSIFLDQISIGLSVNCNWRFAVCSPESYPLPFYFSRLIKRIIGRSFDKKNILRSDLELCKQWLEDRYYMIMPEDGFSLDTILDKTRSLVLRKGVNALIIDPWNRIEKNQPKHLNEAQWIAICLTKIIDFAKRNGIHIFLVAHPTKMTKNQSGMNYNLPNLYSISGSAHFYNMTHNGLTVFRNFDTGKTEVHVQKVKWEHLGRIGLVEYQYNKDNARFDDLFKHDESNWLYTRIYKDREVQTKAFQVDQSDLRKYGVDEVPF